MNSKDEKIKEFLKSVAPESIGGAGAVSLGLLFGSPAVAILGAVVAPSVVYVIKEKLLDFSSRVLSKSEKTNIIMITDIILEKINKKITTGQEVRQDDLWTTHNDGTNYAGEIYEGALMKARNEFQQKKLKIFANIVVNVYLDSGYSANEANHLLHLVESFTYRKLCVLKIITDKTNGVLLNLKKTDYRKSEYTNDETFPILQEIYELVNRGLAYCVGENNDGGDYLLGYYEVVPDRMRLNEMGERYSKIMELSDIEDDLVEIIDILK